MAVVEERAVGRSWTRTRPPRVLHVITALGTGGAERQLDGVVQHSSTPMRTIALYAGGTIGDAMAARGQHVEVLGMGGGPGRVTGLLRLVRAIRRHRPDAVHVHLLAAQLWGIPAARLAGVPVVVSSEHSLMDDTIENRPLTPRLRAVYLLLERMATHTVAVSATTKERLIRWGVRGQRISVIDNGIDFAALQYSPSERDRVRRELGIAPGATVVGGVGRLEPVKRFPQLLDALAPTLRVGERELVLVGDGPLRDDLLRRAHSLGVAEAVHLTGPRSDVPALLSAMDVLVSPSRDETFGMAVVEALGSGLPVVHGQCPALDELERLPPAAFPLSADDGTPDGESAALLTGVDAALAAAAAAGGRFEPDPALTERYGIGRTVEQLEDLYRRVAR